MHAVSDLFEIFSFGAGPATGLALIKPTKGSSGRPSRKGSLDLADCQSGQVQSNEAQKRKWEAVKVGTCKSFAFAKLSISSARSTYRFILTELASCHLMGLKQCCDSQSVINICGSVFCAKLKKRALLVHG